MKRNDLQAMRFYARQLQKVIFETHNCVIRGCDKCDYAYICEITNLIVEVISRECDKYDAKGELKDDK